MAGEQPWLAGDDRQARTQHLLGLPVDAGDDEVEVLAVSRFGSAHWEVLSAAGPPPRTGRVPVVSAALGRRPPPASIRPSRALRLGRLSTLVGPYRTDEGGATALGLPASTTTVWRLDCPPARGEAPRPGGDRDGLKRAFPQGVPVREEERAVRWLIDVARRLHGSVRVAASGVVLTPDPEAAIDLTVLTDRWLEPAEALGVVRRLLPRARPSGYEAPGWVGPAATETPAARRRLGQHGLSDASLRARLAAEADAFDAYWLANPPDAHAYGVEVDLGLDGMLVVEVAEESVLPPLLVGLAWTAGVVVAYRVHWEPMDVEDLETERPALGHRVARGRTAPQVQAIARALYASVGGEVVDESGFLVNPDDLEIERR